MKKRRARDVGGSEESHCAAFWQWVLLNEARFPELQLMFHIVNEGKRLRITGARLRAIGLRKGVLDYCLPVARSGYAGLWMEFKSKRGRLTKEQREYGVKLLKEGHLVIGVRTWEEAAAATLRYLGAEKAIDA